jgi:AraC-like DNA-binding protein
MSPKIPPLAFGQSRALSTCNIEDLGDLSIWTAGLLRIGHIEALEPEVPVNIALSSSILEDVSLFAGSSTGLRLCNVHSPLTDLALLVPLYKFCASPAWGGDRAIAGQTMGLLTDEDQGTEVEGLHGCVFAFLDRARFRDVWRTMLGPEAGAGTPVPDLAEFGVINTGYGSVDFGAALRALFEIIDAFNADPAALATTHVPDRLYRILASAVTPHLFFDVAEVNEHEHDPKQAGLEAICDRVRSDFSAPLSLTQMEKISGYSRRSLQYAFKQKFGMTPIEWQLDERLKAASEMLLSAPDQSVTHIAHEVGFTSSSAFSQYFKRRFGVTPSASRKK